MRVAGQVASFTSPLAITTSKASPVQRYHTGTVWALPSLR